MKKGIIIVLIIAVLGGIGAYFYVFHKPHRNPSEEKASYELAAVELAMEFKQNQAAANEKYIDKVVEISGTAMDVRDTYIIMDNVVNCNAVEGHDFQGSIQAGDELIIKGRVIGYDDLLEEVKLDNCVKP